MRTQLKMAWALSALLAAGLVTGAAGPAGAQENDGSDKEQAATPPETGAIQGSDKGQPADQANHGPNVGERRDGMVPVPPPPPAGGASAGNPGAGGAAAVKGGRANKMDRRHDGPRGRRKGMMSPPRHARTEIIKGPSSGNNQSGAAYPDRKPQGQPERRDERLQTQGKSIQVRTTAVKESAQKPAAAGRGKAADRAENRTARVERRVERREMRMEQRRERREFRAPRGR